MQCCCFVSYIWNIYTNKYNAYSWIIHFFVFLQINVGVNIKSQIVDLDNIINNKTIPSLISVNSLYIFIDHILIVDKANILPCYKTLSFA